MSAVVNESTDPVFPASLAERPAWLIWKLIQKPGQKKPSKMPYYASGMIRGWPHGKPRDGEPTEQQPQVEQGHELDRAALVTYPQALAACRNLGFDGVGFAFLPGDGLIGIDLDACVGEGADPARLERAAKIVGAVGSYTELSPSGKGVHIICAGETETFKSDKIGVEVFCGRQFFTMTGRLVAGSVAEVASIPAHVLEKLRRTVQAAKDAGKPARAVPPPASAPARNAGADVTRYCMAALESAVQRLRSAAEGGRNDLLNGEAFGLAQLVHSGGISEATIWGTLSVAAEACGLDKAEIEATLKSGIRAGLADPRGIPERQPRPAPARPTVSGPPDDMPDFDPETGEILETQADREPPQHANDNGPREHGFRILGYAGSSFYVLPSEKKQITAIGVGDMTENGLLALAPLEYWQSYFPHDKQAFDRKTAVNWLIRRAYEAGVFNPNRVRGRGAWIDRERVVYHMGSHLVVDGGERPLTELPTRFIYQAEIPLPDLADAPLSDEEGEELIDIAKMFRWTMPASAALLPGWIALAPICGALRWRPHVWLTGGPGCGKSTILNDFTHGLLDGVDLFAQGNSTEAGLRQTLNSDALPVLFDESEQNNEREESRVQNVLALIRQASSESGAQTFKGTAGGKAMHFHVRSMFCLASIQVGIKQQADRERLTVLALRPKHDDGGTGEAAAQWVDLQDRLHVMGRNADVIRPRLIRRAIDLLPTTLRNIETFVRVATEHFGNARTGDQYGTLLAGAWSLTSTGLASREDALEMIQSYEWAEYTESQEQDEASRALQALLEAKIRIASSEYSVSELALKAANLQSSCLMEVGDANDLLRRHGMKVVGDKMMGPAPQLLVSNNSFALTKLLNGTPFAADLRGQLLRVKGVTKHPKAERFSGYVNKCVAVPISLIE